MKTINNTDLDPFMVVSCGTPATNLSQKQEKNKEEENNNGQLGELRDTSPRSGERKISKENAISEFIKATKESWRVNRWSDIYFDNLNSLYAAAMSNRPSISNELFEKAMLIFPNKLMKVYLDNSWGKDEVDKLASKISTLLDEKTIQLQDNPQFSEKLSETKKQFETYFAWEQLKQVALALAKKLKKGSHFYTVGKKAKATKIERIVNKIDMAMQHVFCYGSDPIVYHDLYAVIRQAQQGNPKTIQDYQNNIINIEFTDGKHKFTLQSVLGEHRYPSANSVTLFACGHKRKPAKSLSELRTKLNLTHGL